MVQKIKTSQVRQHTALSTIGSVVDENAELVLEKVNQSLSKLLSENSISLVGGGNITATAAGLVTFESAISLIINQHDSASVPTTISLGIPSATTMADGDMLYAIINRATSSGSAVFASQIPSTAAANGEIIVLAKRIGSFLRFATGQSVPLSSNSFTLESADKSVINSISIEKFMSFNIQDMSATGSDVVLTGISAPVIKLTDSGLSSIAGIDVAGLPGFASIKLYNKTGAQITLLNDSTAASAGQRIKFQNAEDVLLNEDAAIELMYTSDSNWIAIGGVGGGSGSGSGSLDTIFQLTGDAPISGWTVTRGSFTKETVNPLHGKSSFKLTLGSSLVSLKSPTFEIDRKFRGNRVVFSNIYNYNGAANDLEFKMYDAATDLELPGMSAKVLESPSNISNVVIYGILPLATESVYFKVNGLNANLNKVLVFDDVQFSLNTNDFLNLDNTSLEPAGLISADFQGFGTSGNNLRSCKRGEFLIIKGSFTPGVTSATLASLNLKFNGKTLTVADGFPTNTLVGFYTRNANVPAKGGSFLAKSGDSFITFSRGNLFSGESASSLSPANGDVVATSGETLSFDIEIPIKEWQVQTPMLAKSTDFVSNETINFRYRAASEVNGLSALANAAIGDYITFTYAANTNTRTQTSARPAQTDASISQNGIQVFTRTYNAASTAAQPACIAIQIGKGFKACEIGLYKNANKDIKGSLDYSTYENTANGAVIKEYDDKTGILIIDPGSQVATSINFAAYFRFSDVTYATNGFVTFAASKTPAITAVEVPMIQPTILVGENLNNIVQLTADDNIADWSVTGSGSFNKTNVDPIHGEFSYTYSSSAVGSGFIRSPGFTVEPKFKATPITLSLFFKNVVVGSPKLSGTIYDATNDVVLDTFTADLVATNGVLKFETVGMIPASCDKIKFQLNNEVASGQSFELMFDDVEIGMNLDTYANMSEGSGFVPATFSTLNWQSMGTVTNNLKVSRSSNGELVIIGSVNLGTVDNSLTAIMPLPSNFGNITVADVNTVEVGSYLRNVSNLSKGGKLIRINGENVLKFSSSAVYGGGEINPLVPVTGLAVAPTGTYVTINARIPIKEWQIQTPMLVKSTEAISSDTINFRYRTSSEVAGLSALANANIGDYITFTYVGNTNTRTQTTTRPTQTDADMNVNGIQMFTRAYNAASTAAQPACIAIQIGKNFAGNGRDFLQIYKNIGKTTVGELNVVRFPTDITVRTGFEIIGYEPRTGVLIIDAGLSASTGMTAPRIEFSDATIQTNGYVTFSASKSPALVGIQQPKRFVVKTYQSGNDSYVVYNDGWVEQRYFIIPPTNAEHSLTFLIPMRDTSYYAFTDYFATNTGNNLGDWQISIVSRTATSINYASSMHRFIKIEGYASVSALAAMGIIV